MKLAQSNLETANIQLEGKIEEAQHATEQAAPDAGTCFGDHFHL